MTARKFESRKNALQLVGPVVLVLTAKNLPFFVYAQNPPLNKFSRKAVLHRYGPREGTTSKKHLKYIYWNPMKFYYVKKRTKIYVYCESHSCSCPRGTSARVIGDKYDLNTYDYMPIYNHDYIKTK